MRALANRLRPLHARLEGVEEDTKNTSTTLARLCSTSQTEPDDEDGASTTRAWSCAFDVRTQDVSEIAIASKEHAEDHSQHDSNKEAEQRLLKVTAICSHSGPVAVPR